MDSKIKEKHSSKSGDKHKDKDSEKKSSRHKTEASKTESKHRDSSKNRESSKRDHSSSRKKDNDSAETKDSKHSKSKTKEDEKRTEVEKSSKSHHDKRSSSKERSSKEKNESSAKVESSKTKSSSKTESKPKESSKDSKALTANGHSNPMKETFLVDQNKSKLPVRESKKEVKVDKVDKVSVDSRSMLNGNAVKEEVKKPEKQQQPVPKAVSKQVDEVDDYEDDFEDYDDDFEEEEADEEVAATTKKSDSPSEDEEESEEDDESEARDSVPMPVRRVQEVEKPRKAESAASETSSRPRSIQSRIDFTRATHTEAQLNAATRTTKRGKELLNLVDLDSLAFDIFELPPVRDYDFYIQSFGKSNRIQIQTQTGDDCVERDIQSEDIDNETKWTQHPPTDLHGCGGETAARSFKDQEVRFDTEIFNSSKFRQFIERSGQLVCGLLDEESGSDSKGQVQHKSDPNFSEGYSLVSLGPLAQQSTVTAVVFSPIQPHLLVTAFYVTQSVAADLTKRGVLCVWNVNQLSVPYRLLYCDSTPLCCCFGEDHSGTVFAGLNDGSVVAWDLQESESLHQQIPWGKEEVAMRAPTYDTSYLCTNQDIDKAETASPIVSICTISSTQKKESTGADSSSYQVACLEARGVIHIWTVILSQSPEVSELDLGLRPGGKLKLIKSATLKPSSIALRCLTADPDLKTSALQAFVMTRNREDQSQFYVGTDTGYVLHVLRDDNRAGPKALQSDLEALSDVLSLDFSPFCSEILLAGSSDGCISIFRVSYSKPLASFQYKENKSITQVRWSTVSPYTFYAVHGGNVLTVWDLKSSLNQPTYVRDLKEGTPVSHIAEAAGSESVAYFAMGRENGTVEVHVLKPQSKKYTKEDGSKLLRILNSM